MKTKYLILTGNSSSELSDRVTLFIEQGWKLQGGISISMTNRLYASIIYAQAVTKEN